MVSWKSGQTFRIRRAQRLHAPRLYAVTSHRAFTLRQRVPAADLRGTIRIDLAARNACRGVPIAGEQRGVRTVLVHFASNGAAVGSNARVLLDARIVIESRIRGSSVDDGLTRIGDFACIGLG